MSIIGRFSCACAKKIAKKSKIRLKSAILSNFDRKVAAKTNSPKHTAYAICQTLTSSKRTGRLRKIVGAVFKKSPKNLQKWPKKAKKGHFGRFFALFSTNTNFYGKFDTASVFATSKYIKNDQRQKEKKIGQSPAQKNTYSRCFFNVCPTPDF